MNTWQQCALVLFCFFGGVFVGWVERGKWSA
jgi:hypothetical protein